MTWTFPTVSAGAKSNTYTGGACAVVAETPWAPLGIAICYDLRFPALYRALAEAGADDPQRARLFHQADR